MKKVYPINAYQMFCADNLENIKEEIKDPNGNVNHLEIQQILKCRWKTMTENEKRIYKERATQHRKQILKDEDVAITTMYQNNRKLYRQDIHKQREKLRRRTAIPFTLDPSLKNLDLLSRKEFSHIPYNFSHITQSPYIQTLINGEFPRKSYINPINLNQSPPHSPPRSPSPPSPQDHSIYLSYSSDEE
jgi:hypothetical protein